MNNSEQTVLLT